MLALIIVYYQQKKELDAFLNSLSKSTDRGWGLYVADLTGKLKIDQDYAFSIKIIPGENKGYSYGVNLGIKAAIKDRYNQFVILNYDTIVAKDFIKKVNNRFQSSPIFGGKIYYAPGYEYHHKRYTQKDLGKVLWYAGGQINWNHATTTHLGVDEVDKGQYDCVVNTGFIPGTLFAFAKEVWEKVGPWDEHFFLYYEDTDYSARILEKGYKLVYDPQIIIWHKNAGTTGGPGSELHIREQRRSRLYFGLKHAPLRTKIHLILNWLANKL